MPASEVMNPTILNVTLTNANTQYSVTIPGGTKHFSVQCRTAFDVRFAFVTGKVNGPTAPYATIKSGGAYTAPEKLGYLGGELYLASAEAGVAVEVVCWG
jgi:hypothetical protein